MEEVGKRGVPAHSQTQYVLNLYKAVVEEAPDENAVLSPLSISLALAMVAAGAQGSTLQQIAACLHLPPGNVHSLSARLKAVLQADASKHGLELSCANSIWVDESVHLKPSFQNVLSTSYGAAAASVDFVHKAEEARGLVNKWAADSTQGKITDVLPPDSVTTDTRLILANAIYFKGTWKDPFDESLTLPSDFYLSDGTTVKVPMMYSSKKQYIKSFSSFKALRLPYKLRNDATRAFSMIVLLPNDRNGLRQMEAELDGQNVVENLELTEKKPVLNFRLPKFKVSFGAEVSEMLKAMGMELAFGDGADLGNMVDGDERLCVSSVRQKAFVEVNEKGTEAAAVTTVEIALMCAVFGLEENFVADHPFMFLIKEESSNTIIFTGRVVNPSKE